MLGQPSEDAQPNEARLNRKGASYVPTIRTTRPRGSFGGHFRGGRGGTPLPPIPPPSTNTSIPLPVRYVGRDATFTQRFKRPLSPDSRGESSMKQARFGYEFQNPRIIPRGDSSGQVYRNKRSKNLIESLYFELPHPCRPGAYESRRHRAQWVNEQVSILEVERGIKVLGHSFIEDKVRFEFRRSDYHDRSPPSNIHTAGKSASAVHQNISVLPPEGMGPDVEVRRQEVGRTTDQRRISTSRSYVRDSSPRVIPGQLVNLLPAEFLGRNDDSETSTSYSGVSLQEDNVDPGKLGLQTKVFNKLPAINQDPTQIQHACFSCRSGTFNIKMTSAARQATIWTNDIASEVNADAPVQFAPPQCGIHEIGSEFFDSGTLSPSGIAQVETHSRSSDTHDGMSLNTGSNLTTSESSRLEHMLQIRRVSEVIRLPKEQYDRPRRILATSDCSLIAVTMRGHIHRTVGTSRQWQPEVWNGPNLLREQVDDACILPSSHRTYLLLGHARERKQISVLRIGENELLKVGSFDRPAGGTDKGGVSAIAALMQPYMFVTGGYDHLVHAWTLEGDDSLRSSSQQLSVKHASLIHSLLAIRDTSHKLITAGADCTVHIWDLSSERAVHSLKTSNPPYHAHRTDSPFCTLLEVAHRELQFEVRDHRMVPEKPVQRLGYLTQNFHGRFMKGDTSSFHFISGGRDGCIRVWDLRQLTRACDVIECFPNRKVMQVKISNGNIIACSEDHHVSTLDYNTNIFST